MPQGGPGNCGGNLNGSGGSKKKMSSKQKHTTKVWHSKKGKRMDRGAELGEPDAGPAYNVHAPSPEQRAAVLRAHEELDLRRLLTSTRPVEGTAPGGETLGGGVAATDSAHDAREARLRYFQQREASGVKKQTDRLRLDEGGHARSGDEQMRESARSAVSELPQVKRVRARAGPASSGALGSEDTVCSTVRRLLDMLVEIDTGATLRVL